MNQLDEIICSFDRGLRTLTGGHQAVRDYPGANFSEAPLSEEERAHIVGLMRVNHTGEVCAQALYEGQALTAKGEDAKSALLAAAGEEQDHLVWCEQRLSELEGGPSALAPVFFGLSYAVGAAAGLLGDRVSLGFVEATEDQVVKHLDGHLASLPDEDRRTREVLEAMRADETRHGEEALARGGVEFPKPLKQTMQLLARAMTLTSYRI